MGGHWNDEREKEFRARLVAARDARGLSLEAVAKRVGVSKATVGHWETGERTIKHHDLAAVCAVLGISADELLFGVQRWPFQGVDFAKVADLERPDLTRLEGAIILTAAQLGVDVQQTPPSGTSGKHVLPRG